MLYRKGDSLGFIRNSLLVCGLIAVAAGLPGNRAWGQSAEPLPPAPHAKQTHLKHVLVIGETKGYEHDSISATMAAVYNMGKESGLWDTIMRTDAELLTKKDLGNNAKNLKYFDLIVFASTTGDLDMDASPKQDMLSFIKRSEERRVGKECRSR